jgi:polyhydroxyalkanoate synthesis regulator phasin
MDSNNLVQFLQTGFHVSLGITTALIESLQDPQKREENFSQLNSDFEQQLATLEEKGKITEQEARSYLESMWTQQNNSGSSASADTPTNTSATSPTSTTTANTQQEIEELTAQISALRTELEQLRQSN